MNTEDGVAVPKTTAPTILPRLSHPASAAASTTKKNSKTSAERVKKGTEGAVPKTTTATTPPPLSGSAGAARGSTSVKVITTKMQKVPTTKIAATTTTKSKPSTTTIPNKIIYVPNTYDVLLGRGKRYYNHEGNIRMLNIVIPYREQYKCAKKKHDKSIISKRVLSLIMNPYYMIPGDTIEQTDAPPRPTIRFLQPLWNDNVTTTTTDNKVNVVDQVVNKNLNDFNCTGFYQVSYNVAHKKVCHALRDLSKSKDAVLERQQRLEEQQQQEGQAEGNPKPQKSNHESLKASQQQQSKIMDTSSNLLSSTSLLFLPFVVDAIGKERSSINGDNIVDAAATGNPTAAGTAAAMAVDETSSKMKASIPGKHEHDDENANDAKMKQDGVTADGSGDESESESDDEAEEEVNANLIKNSYLFGDKPEILSTKRVRKTVKKYMIDNDSSSSSSEDEDDDEEEGDGDSDVDSDSNDTGDNNDDDNEDKQQKETKQEKTAHLGDSIVNTGTFDPIESKRNRLKRKLILDSKRNQLKKNASAIYQHRKKSYTDRQRRRQIDHDDDSPPPPTPPPTQNRKRGIELLLDYEDDDDDNTNTRNNKRNRNKRMKFREVFYSSGPTRLSLYGYESFDTVSNVIHNDDSTMNDKSVGNGTDRSIYATVQDKQLENDDDQHNSTKKTLYVVKTLKNGWNETYHDMVDASNAFGQYVMPSHREANAAFKALKKLKFSKDTSIVTKTTAKAAPIPTMALPVPECIHEKETQTLQPQSTSNKEATTADVAKSVPDFINEEDVDSVRKELQLANVAIVIPPRTLPHENIQENGEGLGAEEVDKDGVNADDLVLSRLKHMQTPEFRTARMQVLEELNKWEQERLRQLQVEQQLVLQQQQILQQEELVQETLQQVLQQKHLQQQQQQLIHVKHQHREQLQQQQQLLHVHREQQHQLEHHQQQRQNQERLQQNFLQQLLEDQQQYITSSQKPSSSGMAASSVVATVTPTIGRTSTRVENGYSSSSVNANPLFCAASKQQQGVGHIEGTPLHPSIHNTSSLGVRGDRYEGEDNLNGITNNAPALDVGTEFVVPSTRRTDRSSRTSETLILIVTLLVFPFYLLWFLSDPLINALKRLANRFVGIYVGENKLHQPSHYFEPSTYHTTRSPGTRINDIAKANRNHTTESSSNHMLSAMSQLSQKSIPRKSQDIGHSLTPPDHRAEASLLERRQQRSDIERTSSKNALSVDASKSRKMQTLLTLAGYVRTLESHMPNDSPSGSSNGSLEASKLKSPPSQMSSVSVPNRLTRPQVAAVTPASTNPKFATRFFANPQDS